MSDKPLPCQSKRFFFDTEFIEDGKTIALLSIGIVSEDGRTYYAEPHETDQSRASEWVKANVIPFLTGPRKSKEEIRADILRFVGKDRPEFWAYYADYDWVALCQLFGTMMDLPKGWPMYCRDIKQLAVSLGDPQLPNPSGQDHNALDDARHGKAMWEFLNRRTPSPAREDLALREKLADLCHEQWSGWMRYLFSKCLPAWDDKTQLVIPAWAVERWKRQVSTSYVNLGPDEKESDRKEADRFLALLPPSKSEAEIRAEVWEEAAVEAKKERVMFLSKDDLAHQDRDLKVRATMRRQIANACRERAKSLRDGAGGKA